LLKPAEQTTFGSARPPHKAQQGEPARHYFAGLGWGFLPFDSFFLSLLPMIKNLRLVGEIANARLDDKKPTRNADIQETSVIRTPEGQKIFSINT